MSNTTRLQYSISSWEQAQKCLSNNSKDLSIKIIDFFNNKDIDGKLITVKHKLHGILFAAMIDGKGRMISDSDDEGSSLEWLDTTSILSQLEKFGFDITFSEEKHLSGQQYELIATMLKLGLDKLTKIRVSKDNNEKVVAFNSSKCTDLLTFGIKISLTQFNKLIEEGIVLNLSSVTYKDTFDWDWLIYVSDIKKIMDANSENEVDYEDYTTYDPSTYTGNTEGLTPYDSEEVNEPEDSNAQ